ncbi:MAG: hypothetical protein KDI29_00835 [Pseudomonadales bacterium]|nr:hypothetical protein [Pseudomonadales bacterium]
MNRKLADYRSKRNLEKSGEPRGGSSGRKPAFVIQKHDASNLHYDFRLELGGVLKSWAVPKGLSTAAGEKRLAVRTEDHPLDYQNFEGRIPEGQYGGGTVMIWDCGTFSPLDKGCDSEKDLLERLEDGSFKIWLRGEKLQGGYAMARMENADSEAQWLIFKLDDRAADGRRNPVSSEPDSVRSGRSLGEIAEDESAGESRG